MGSCKKSQAHSKLVSNTSVDLREKIKVLLLLNLFRLVVFHSCITVDLNVLLSDWLQLKS